MRHVTPDNKILLGHKDEMQIALGPRAKAHDCAENAVFMGVLSTLTVDFLEVSLQETETIYD